MPAHSYRLILFDFDGTLVDSQANILRCMRQSFLDAGLEPPLDRDIRRIVGLSLDEAIERLLPLERKKDSVARVCEGYRRAFLDWRQHPDYEEPLFPGVRPTLERLNEPEVFLGIATGKNRRGLSASLDHHGLAHLFCTFQTPDTSPGKPHPGMVLRAMEEVACQPEETLLIGDTTYDIEMARNAGINAIGVKWGYHEAHELISAGALRVLDDFSEIPDHLSDLVETEQ
ncbi:HAD-IA family hydrolase [Fodinicurvata fenggangensis]|uniref:HAD-IA family hydrolase n=1 Tax=Fodinicurvata fenggangensis TaxID=1121830 RepID=UPI00047BAE08|nr:HAD-IA family hydrolase [Fodinicurvata fenggangensis]